MRAFEPEKLTKHKKIHIIKKTYRLVHIFINNVDKKILFINTISLAFQKQKLREDISIVPLYYFFILFNDF